MSWYKKIFKSILNNEDIAEIKASSWRQVINGEIFTKTFFKKQYRLLIMISILAFMYVDNRYYCETQLAKVLELKKQIQDVKYESLTISAQLVELSRQSSVIKLVKERGINLEETDAPPVVIEDSVVSGKQ